jgi:hypothetical protein
MTVDAGSHPGDRHAEPPGRVRPTALPAGARELATLDRIDYEDAFLVDTGLAQDRTAERWARKSWKAPRRAPAVHSPGDGPGSACGSARRGRSGMCSAGRSGTTPRTSCC